MCQTTSLSCAAFSAAGTVSRSPSRVTAFSSCVLGAVRRLLSGVELCALRYIRDKFHFLIYIFFLLLKRRGFPSSSSHVSLVSFWHFARFSRLKETQEWENTLCLYFFFFFYPSAHLKALCKECSRSAVRRRTRSEDAVRIQRLPELSWKPGVVQDTLFAPHLLRVTLYL